MKFNYIKIAKREIILTQLPNSHFQLFYRSTGINSKANDTFFPLEGIALKQFLKPHGFNHPANVEKELKKMVRETGRFGSVINIPISMAFNSGIWENSSNYQIMQDALLQYNISTIDDIYELEDEIELEIDNNTRKLQQFIFIVLKKNGYEYDEFTKDLIINNTFINPVDIVNLMLEFQKNNILLNEESREIVLNNLDNIVDAYNEVRKCGQDFSKEILQQVIDDPETIVEKYKNIRFRLNQSVDNDSDSSSESESMAFDQFEEPFFFDQSEPLVLHDYSDDEEQTVKSSKMHTPFYENDSSRAVSSDCDCAPCKIL
ncbi:MAG: hypothetical protein EP298_10775 [Gammaproteobacteria bacterium]|nr:MAG: hypothetical protein EP298_10775 [Gammaproteobacteria bacterium]UTW43872.1 hypothetical protein KFE69_07215 [bacterium SCSIO 12844]